MFLDTLLLNPKIRRQAEKDNSPTRKAEERKAVFFLLSGLGHGYVAQAWPMEALGLTFESLGQLKMFKAAEAEIQVPRDSVLSFQ